MSNLSTAATTYGPPYRPASMQMKSMRPRINCMHKMSVLAAQQFNARTRLYLGCFALGQPRKASRKKITHVGGKGFHRKNFHQGVEQDESLEVRRLAAQKEEKSARPDQFK
jgi:hypothetical protein